MEKPTITAGGRADSRWLVDAKWGFFTHFMAHMASDPGSVMPREQWIRKVNALDPRKLADQLAALKTPYFFITIGQHRMYYCTPNETFDKHFGVDMGVRPERDLIAEIAREVTARGIRMCVYINAHGSFEYPDGKRHRKPGDTKAWIDVLTEWSDRWGKLISAWWVDGGLIEPYDTYQAYFKALKSGNPDALVATKLWSKLPDEQVLEDYTDGESGFLLQVDSRHFHGAREGVTDKLPLHFLTFLGEFWGYGEPRFPVELVTGWTQHINKLGGTVSWDCPITDGGEIPQAVFKQLEVLSRKVGRGGEQ